ncbi:MAG: recombination-associated protein RdgC [Pseudomonadota bacterium]
MWFKNLFLYRFTQPFTLSADTLDQKLAGKAFQPVDKLSLYSTGWTEPLGHEGEQLVHTTNGYMMICLRKEEKILPPAAVREILDARALEIEQRDNRKIRGKERSALRDEVLLDMMPRAFTKNSRIYAYIDPRGGWLVVDAASVNRADEFVASLREAIEQLHAVPLAMASDPSVMMTTWLDAGAAPAGFEIEDECELRDPVEDGGIVRMRKHDLGSSEIRSHLEAGKMATRLALSYDDRINFVLDSSMALKRLRFLDLVMDEAGEIDSESAAARFDGDFSIMTLELARFFPRLLEALGGEAEAQELDAA